MATHIDRAIAERVSQGTETNAETERLAEISERVQLNRLWGMPDRNKYPAFRDDLTIEQVRSAIAFLRAGDKYAAEKTIYPPQSKAALKDGFFLMLKAGHQAQKAEEVEQEFTQDS